MAIVNNGIQRRPPHPGEILREDFLPDYKFTVSGLAREIGVSRQSVKKILRERRSLSPEMALRLAYAIYPPERPRRLTGYLRCD